MALRVYDYRSDIANLLVTPQIRCRFLKMAVGQFNAGHTHDLGHEIFLILQGRAEFEIDGERAVRELRHFHECITAGVPNRTPLADARDDIRLIIDIVNRYRT